MFYGYFQVNKHLNKIIMNTIEEKIEKGKKIAEIVENIKQLENISDILNDYINVKIYKSTSLLLGLVFIRYYGIIGTGK